MSDKYEDMSREALMAALEAAQETTGKQIVFKVSPKGAVQINGMRRFPITFYKNEWETLFSLKDGIVAFINEHDAELKTK
jgi:hypothetical protein